MKKIVIAAALAFAAIAAVTLAPIDRDAKACDREDC